MSMELESVDIDTQIESTYKPDEIEPSPEEIAQMLWIYASDHVITRFPEVASGIDHYRDYFTWVILGRMLRLSKKHIALDKPDSQPLALLQQFYALFTPNTDITLEEVDRLNQIYDKNIDYNSLAENIDPETIKEISHKASRHLPDLT